MTEAVKIVRIAGDGVGPELVAAGSQLVEAVGIRATWIDEPAGLAAYHEHGATAPPGTIEAVRRCGAALKGPFATPSGGTIRSANHYIRRELDLYACLRPIPIAADRPVLLVRENVEDLYGAVEWLTTPDVAHAVKIATRDGCRRIARYAFDLARRESRHRVTVVHKANNLKLTEGMFLEVATDLAKDYPELTVDDMLADTACAVMVTDPAAFDVVLTSNTFGDLLSGVGAAVAGSLGLVGSLNTGAGVVVAEAGHGSADHLAGSDRVNPVAFLDSVGLLLTALGYGPEGRAATAAVRRARDDGPRTLDLGGTARTSEVTRFVCDTAAAMVDTA